MATFVIFLIIIGTIIIFRFVSAQNSDKNDLLEMPLEEKFSVIIYMINQFAYNGNGEIHKLSTNELNLYEYDSNQIVNLYYTVGSLGITWKYKYFQKEMIYEKTFYKVRNLSLLEQEAFAKIIIDEMSNKVIQHKIMF